MHTLRLELGPDPSSDWTSGLGQDGARDGGISGFVGFFNLSLGMFRGPPLSPALLLT